MDWALKLMIKNLKDVNMKQLLLILLSLVLLSTHAQSDWTFDHKTQRFLNVETNKPIQGVHSINFNGVIGSVSFENGTVKSAGMRAQSASNEDFMNMDELNFEQIAEYLFRGQITTNSFHIITPDETFYFDSCTVFWNNQWSNPATFFSVMDLESAPLFSTYVKTSYYKLSADFMENLPDNGMVICSIGPVNSPYSFVLSQNYQKLEKEQCRQLRTEISAFTNSMEDQVSKAQILLKYKCYADAFIIYKNIVDNQPNSLDYKTLFWNNFMQLANME